VGKEKSREGQKKAQSRWEKKKNSQFSSEAVKGLPVNTYEKS